MKNDLSTTASHAKPSLKPCVAASTAGCAPTLLHPVFGDPPLNARRSAAEAPAAQSRSGPGAGRGRRPDKPERAAKHSPELQATQARGAGDACPPARALGRDRAFGTPPLTPIASRLPRLLAVSEVARLLQVSTKTTRRWIESGELHVHHLGRQLRVSEEDLAAFLNRCRT